jgi:hypothetical protein
LAAWRIQKLSVTPKCQGSEDHACDQFELLQGVAGFCEDWVEQLQQLGQNNQPEKDDNQEQRPKTQTAHQMGAVEWKSKGAGAKE